MERERKVERTGDDTAERPADAAGSGPSAHVQFKGGGDIPAVGGSFRARTSDTDVAYETTPAGDAPVQRLAAPAEPQGESVQLLRGSLGGAGKPGKVRTDPTTGVTEVWSATENKWIVDPDHDGSGGGTSGGGGG